MIIVVEWDDTSAIEGDPKLAVHKNYTYFVLEDPAKEESVPSPPEKKRKTL